MDDLKQRHFDWFEAIVNDAHIESSKWDLALLTVQKSIVGEIEREALLQAHYQIKVHGHVRFVNLPALDSESKRPFPNYMNIGEFRQLTANVVRISITKLLEIKSDFICDQCNETITLNADYELMYMFDITQQS